jgi:UDP-galactopyranose mutase
VLQTAKLDNDHGFSESRISATSYALTISGSQAGSHRDILCFSHLRWNFVYQRPQHLMSRFAQERRVFFFEEPIVGDELALRSAHTADGVIVLTPVMPSALDEHERIAAQRRMVDETCLAYQIDRPVLWYYGPMSGAYTDHLAAAAVVYDCMDEHTAFAGAPLDMHQSEQRLLQRADIVFTGGLSLYEAKRQRHPQVHLFPSSVDLNHFSQAREALPAPADQAEIPHPRIGHYAVLDERLDRDLVGAIADRRPDWQLVLVGPVVKIDPATLPRRPNIHYLGGKSYEELPAYLSGWDVAFMPFALNESTRFISPTKTPEYLAAAKPVVSAPINDVVTTYGKPGLVRIAASPDEFCAAIEDILCNGERPGWLKDVDQALKEQSWDLTWNRMVELLP